MAILLDERTTVLIQGITGREGTARARFMADYGTKVVAGVTNVHWLDLGMPEATWVLKVNRLGPLVVGIDSEGNVLVQRVLDEARTRIENMYREDNIDSKRTYVWWPKKIAGSKEIMESEKHPNVQ